MIGMTTGTQDVPPLAKTYFYQNTALNYLKAPKDCEQWTIWATAGFYQTIYWIAVERQEMDFNLIVDSTMKKWLPAIRATNYAEK